MQHQSPSECHVEPIIIVGASHAGISCADQLSKNGFYGDIDVINRLNGLPLPPPQELS